MSVLGSFVLPHPPLLVAEVGHGEELSISETAKSVQAIAHKIALLKPDTIILSSPHAPFYQESFFISSEPEENGSLARVAAPRGWLLTSSEAVLVVMLGM